MRYTTVTALAAVAALAACASRPEPAATPPSETTAPSDSQRGPVPGSIEDFRVSVGDRVFFGYDRFDLSTEARSVLERQAAWLRRYPNVRILVAGNCDVRGTREYNLALGARRAAAARDYLVSLGVAQNRRGGSLPATSRIKMSQSHVWPFDDMPTIHLPSGVVHIGPSFPEIPRSSVSSAPVPEAAIE